MESETVIEQNLGLKFENNILQLGLLSIFLLDTLGAVASRMLAFNYANLIIGPLFIYLATGFITAGKKSIKKAVKYAVIIGLFESTICWTVVIMLEPNTGGKNFQPYSVELWVVTVIIVTCLAAFTGLIGAGVATAMKKKIPVPKNVDGY